ncbi:WD40 repeat-like protein [Aureobasidium namibiae CBS 147.97]|uniref:WD40 repeat-like protein n=1 Tax=Aureobasidium namibiae CBS 147.97 TaxID=1043004 RepID=A0A074W8R5_9PEZI|nr:WD40 repeat-like protein [Aureobasidium namibiae CBS 147.97]KEQ69490.1 WD40 repeat-like protein [Aureobasidium namibiae CBS 147.97]
MDAEAEPRHLAFRAHGNHVVTCLLLESDMIITGSDDTTINLYDAQTGALLKTFQAHDGGIWSLQRDGDILVSGSTDQSIRVWSIATGKCLHLLQGHTMTVRCLAIVKPVRVDVAVDGSPVMRPEVPLLVSGSRDSTLRVWRLPLANDIPTYQAASLADVENTYSLSVLTGHQKTIRAMAAYGDTIVSGSFDCTVRVWKISTGDTVRLLTGHTQKIYSVVLDHENRRCISGSMDNSVKIWSLDSGSCLLSLEGHTSLVGLLQLNHGLLVSGAADGTLRVWNPDNGACQTILQHTAAITAFQHDGQKVISGSDRTLKMWDIRTGECVRDLLTDLNVVWKIQYDGKKCVAAVQRDNLTYIEVLDFDAVRDDLPETSQGRRVVVDSHGSEI